jgi:hypothetical protein
VVSVESYLKYKMGEEICDVGTVSMGVVVGSVCIVGIMLSVSE